MNGGNLKALVDKPDYTEHKLSDGSVFQQYSEKQRLLADITVKDNNLRLAFTELFRRKDYLEYLRTTSRGSMEVRRDGNLEYSGDIESIHPKTVRMILEGADAKGEAVSFKGVGWGGGGSYVIESSEKGERINQLIFVIRDTGTFVWPKSLTAQSGFGNATDPLAATLKEQTEEVIVKTNAGRALIPSFSMKEYANYDPVITENITGIAQKMGISAVRFEVEVMKLKDPHRLNGMPVRVGMNYLQDADGANVKFETVEILMPPIKFKLPESGEGSKVEILDTLAIETQGKAPQRVVAAVNLDTTEVKLYDKGQLAETYDRFESFLKDDTYIANSKYPFIPTLAGILNSIESDAKLFRVTDGIIENYHVIERAKNRATAE